MLPREREIYECGVYARAKGLPRTDCPNYPEQSDRDLWTTGWASGYLPRLQENVLVKKTILSLVPEDKTHEFE